MSHKRMTAFVDRIEGDLAILLIEDDLRPVNIPVKFLPDNVEEGTVVTVSFTANSEATKVARDRISALIDTLKRLDT